MRKYVNLSIIGIALFAFIISGCYEQEVVEPITPGGLGYTTATFTTDFTGSDVNEGDTITYNITLNKPVDFDLTFTVRWDTLETKVDAEDADISFEAVTIPAYATEASLSIIFIDDNIPENNEKIKLEVGVFDIGTRYTVVDTENPKLDLTIKNVNDPDGLTVAVGWPNQDDDWDCYFIDEAGSGTPYGTDWVAWAGATGANPETLILKDFGAFWTIADGTYFVDIDPYDVSSNVTNFYISVGYPDQSVEFFEFTFDKAKAAAGDYPMTWAYSALKVVKTGTQYSVSVVPEFQ